jgi:hypothetical protein
LEAFSTKHQAGAPIFPKSGSKVHLASVLSAECATTHCKPKPCSRIPPTRAICICIPFTPVHHLARLSWTRWRFAFNAVFHLHLAGGNSGLESVVTVTASETEVVNGTSWIGSCGPGQKWNWVKVKPTTIEEYSILHYSAAILG